MKGGWWLRGWQESQIGGGEEKWGLKKSKPKVDVFSVAKQQNQERRWAKIQVTGRREA
jgi:hypothetical protein